MLIFLKYFLNGICYALIDKHKLSTGIPDIRLIVICNECLGYLNERPLLLYHLVNVKCLFKQVGTEMTFEKVKVKTASYLASTA